MNISVICEPVFRSSGIELIVVNISVICEQVSEAVVLDG